MVKNCVYVRFRCVGGLRYAVILHSTAISALVAAGISAHSLFKTAVNVTFKNKQHWERQIYSAFQAHKNSPDFSSGEFLLIDRGDVYKLSLYLAGAVSHLR